MDGCSFTSTVSLTDPLPLDIEITETISPNCPNDATGPVSIVISGGTTMYQLIFNEDTIMNNGDTVIISDLPAGLYDIFVSDSNECQLMDSIEVESVSDLQIDSVEITPADCITGELGSLVAAASGGEGELSYSIGGETNNTGVFTEFPFGTYLLIVTDENSCSVEIEIEILLTGDIPIAIDFIGDVACFGDLNGFVQFSVDGPGVYEYELNGNVNSDGSFQNLPASLYTVQVTDEQGCQGTLNFEIGSPDMISIEIVNITPDDGSGNGSVTVVGSGGNGGPYLYSLNFGVPQDSGEFTNLTNSNYTLMVFDSVGCTAETTIILSSIDNIELESKIQLYPNPLLSGNLLKLMSPIQIEQLEIYNLLGERIHKSHHSSNEVSISIKENTAQLLFVHIHTEKGKLTKKLIIQ
jgi:hypothetical protein